MSRNLENLRSLPLPSVAASLGLSQHLHDPHKFRGEGVRVSITGQQFFDHLQCRGGGGAIDLVMHVCACSFRQAVAYLSLQCVSAPDFASPILRPRAAQKPCAPFVRPEPCPATWSAVLAYLTRDRGLDEDLVDAAHAQGLLYAVRRLGHINACFVGQQAAELRAIQGKWYGLAAGSKPDQGGLRLVSAPRPRTLVVAEAPIDCLSYLQLFRTEQEPFLVMSTCGTKPSPPFVEQAQDAGWRVICGYDADQPGDEAAARMMERWPKVERHRPSTGKDWNYQLRYAK